MANSLGRNLKKGDKVVLSGGVVAICGGSCFGNLSFTRGTALDVTINGVEMRADGYDIDEKATMSRFAAENGWIETEEQNPSIGKEQQ